MQSALVAVEMARVDVSLATFFLAQQFLAVLTLGRMVGGLGGGA